MSANPAEELDLTEFPDVSRRDLRHSMLRMCCGGDAAIGEPA